MLIDFSIATAIDVTASYVGANTVAISIRISGQSFPALNVGMTATRLANAWLWGTTQ